MITVSQCTYCKHIQKEDTCPAFPQGIPLNVLFSEIMHTKVLKNQTGITVFEVVDDENARRIYRETFGDESGE